VKVEDWKFLGLDELHILKKRIIKIEKENKLSCICSIPERS